MTTEVLMEREPTVPAMTTDFEIPYACYHRHSCVSNIFLADSVATNEDYARRAVELGHTILSSCEHGCQGNYWECAT